MSRKLTSKEARRVVAARQNPSGGRNGGRPKGSTNRTIKAAAHGTHTRYRRGCRCKTCRGFMADYERARTQR